MNQDNQLPSQHPSLMLDPVETDTGDAMQRRRQQLMALLRGRWHWALLLALLLGPGLAAAGYFAITPVYTAQGRITISPGEQPGVSAADPIRYYERFIKVQADRLRSPEVIEAALRHESWKKYGGGQTEEDEREFRQKLEVDTSHDSQALQVAFTDEDPQVATAGAEAVLDAYTLIFGRIVNKAVSERLSKLQNDRRQIEQEISRREEQKSQLLQAAGGPGLTERRQNFQAQLSAHRRPDSAGQATT